MRITWLQFLRAAAALLVLVGHTLGVAAKLGGYEKQPLPTGIGVDLFFAISGFIMVYASNRLFAQRGAARAFLTRRVMRVGPLYWASTTAVLALMILGSRGWDELPSLGYVVSSYLFLPNGSFGSVDGVAFPVLSVGWTLNYEMLFYTVFSVFLFLPRRRATLCVCATMLLAVALGLIFSPQSILLATWSQPIILEFLFGMLVGNAFLDGAQLSRGLAVVLVAASIAWVVFDAAGLQPLKQTPNDLRRLIGWGIPAVLILAAFVLVPWPMPAWLEKPAALLGDASYSLYLTHPFVLNLWERAWPRMFGSDYLPAMVASGVFLAIAFAIGVHKWAERPFELRLKRRRSAVPRSPLTAEA